MSIRRVRLVTSARHVRLAVAGLCLLAFGFGVASLPAHATSALPPFKESRLSQQGWLYQIKLPGNRVASVYADGRVTIGKAGDRHLRTISLRPALSGYGESADRLRNYMLDRAAVTYQLLHLDARPFVPGRVIVITAPGTFTADRITLSRDQLIAMHGAKTPSELALHAPRYTNDASLNATLAHAAVDTVERLFTGTPSSELAGSASLRPGAPAIDLQHVYRLHVSNDSVLRFIGELRKDRNIIYAEPDWTVTTMNTEPVTLPAAVSQRARYSAQQPTYESFAQQFSAKKSQLPTNYALTTSMDSYLNATGINAAAAYDLVEKNFHELPGQGEIITNVSIGDVTWDGSNNESGFCRWARENAGEPSTMHLIGNQPYLDWPSLPLIPAYVATAQGTLAPPSTEACYNDPSMGEVALDFSVMAPLPHDQQRATALGSGVTDLLGIAPGASYRLVVPMSTYDTGGEFIGYSDILAAFLAAANQQPKPNVITMSLGFGFDSRGFPGRFIEDDPVVEAAISSVVKREGIVVCISANDGLRLFTNAVPGVDGGAAATNLTTNAAQVTDASDLEYSTTPSYDYDSGTIEVGATTLDDIFSANPQDRSLNNVLTNHGTFPETRFNGFTEFASGFGSRVNVATPGDNIPTLAYVGPDYNTVETVLNGGTSASAPMTAAAVAVTLQVARIMGKPFASPAAVRDFLEKNGTQVEQAPQAPSPVSVGKQIDLGHMVEVLLGEFGKSPAPAIARIGITQRLDLSGVDQAFTEDLNPNAISLAGDDGLTGAGLNAYITIAPDWEGIPANARYQLFLTGKPSKLIATTPFVRLLPEQLFAKVGLPLASNSQRTLALTYRAVVGSRVLASQAFQMTFDPTTPALAPGGTSQLLLAPVAPPSVDRSKDAAFTVAYDLSSFPASDIKNPQLVISYPGRTNPITGYYYAPLLTIPLPKRSGTVRVPTAKLPADGVYGLAVHFDSTQPIRDINNLGDTAYVDLHSASAARPTAPLLLANRSDDGAHFLEIPLQGSFFVKYDVTGIPGATGAELEISAPGPSLRWNSRNTFNNPNSNIPDNNGKDSKYRALIQLSGTSGTIKLSAAQAHLVATTTQSLRVFAMKGAESIGQAGDVSSILMDGITTVSGGDILSFDVMGDGVNGLLTTDSTAPLEEGLFLFSDEETLSLPLTLPSQVGAATASQLEAGTSYEWLQALGASIFGNNGSTQNRNPAVIGLMTPPSASGVYNQSVLLSGWANDQDINTFNPLNPLWALPPTAPTILSIAYNEQTPTLAMLLINPADTQYGAALVQNFTDHPSTIQTLTFTPVVAIPDTDYYDNQGWAYDPTRNIAYGIFQDEDYGNTFMGVANFAAGTVSSTALPASLDLTGYDLFDIDPSKQIGGFVAAASAPGAGALYLIDLKTRSAGAGVPLDFTPTQITSDRVNHVFVIRGFGADGYINNTANALVEVYSETGRLLWKSQEDFDMPDCCFGWIATAEGQRGTFLNGKARTGYSLGDPLGANPVNAYMPGFQQIQPFSYSIKEGANQ